MAIFTGHLHAQQKRKKKTTVSGCETRRLGLIIIKKNGLGGLGTLFSCGIEGNIGPLQSPEGNITQGEHSRCVTSAYRGHTAEGTTQKVSQEWQHWMTLASLKGTLRSFGSVLNQLSCAIEWMDVHYSR